MAVAQRIKVTPGITGLSGPRVHIDGPVWHLDVGSSHPGGGGAPKGWAVRPLKRYASWVQNVVRQYVSVAVYKFGYMLENPCIPRYSYAPVLTGFVDPVKICRVRTISRKGWMATFRAM